MDLGEAGELPLLDRVPHELVRTDRVGVVLLLRRGERTELALDAADVRLIQVEVLHEVHAVVATARPAPEIRELAERQQVVRLEKRETVVEVEPLAGLHLLADEVECVVEGDRHQLARSTTA